RAGGDVDRGAEVVARAARPRADRGIAGGAGGPADAGQNARNGVGHAGADGIAGSVVGHRDGVGDAVARRVGGRTVGLENGQVGQQDGGVSVGGTVVVGVAVGGTG